MTAAALRLQGNNPIKSNSTGETLVPEEAIEAWLPAETAIQVGDLFAGWENDLGTSKANEVP